MTGRQDLLDAADRSVASSEKAFDAALRHRAFPPGVGSLLAGSLTITRAGFAPAGEQRLAVIASGDLLRLLDAPIWLSHEAGTGRCTSVTVGQASAIRLMDAAPAWLEPVSTTQHTRRAKAYGSAVITRLTSSPNGAIPVVGAMVPMSWARCTSYAPK